MDMNTKNNHKIDNSISSVVAFSNYCYVDSAFGSPNRRSNVVSVEQLIAPTNIADCYATMFRFRGDYASLYKESGSVKGSRTFPCYADYLWFDIDNTDLTTAQVAARQLVINIEQIDSTLAEHIQFYFSGAKGFHTGIPSALFGMEPSVDLPRIHKQLAKVIAGAVSIDTAIYEHNRLWRIPNTKNSKSGLYKIPLTYDQLATLDIEQIKGLAQKPAGKPYISLTFEDQFEPHPKLVEMYQLSIAEVRRPALKQTVTKSPSNLNTLDKPCLQKLLKGVAIGQRNEAALRLTVAFRKRGDSPDKALSELISWNQRNEQPLDDTEIENTCNSAFTSTYDYGCNDSLLSSLCGDNCPYRSHAQIDPVCLVGYNIRTSIDSGDGSKEVVVTNIPTAFEQLSKNKIPVALLESTTDCSTPIPTAVSMAEIVYLLFDNPSQHYQIAEFFGEKARLIATHGATLIDTDDLDSLKQEAQRYVDFRLDQIACMPKHTRIDELRNLIPYLTTVDKYVLPAYLGRIKKDFKLTVKDIRNWLTDVEMAEFKQLPQEDQKLPEFTEIEMTKGLKLLEDPDLIKKFLSVSQMIGCVGEQDNKLMIFLCLTSRLLNDPISLTVKGESSGGKSFLVESVAGFFPDKEVLQFTSMTPKALFYRKDSLEHKGLIIFERPGAEDSDYSIRTMQSEKKLVISAPSKNEDTGQMETVDFEVKGPIAYIETTTESHLHAENETRCFDLFVDESEQQTREIFDAQKKKYTGFKSDKQALVRPWQALQKQLTSVKVIIPFVHLIDFPTKPVRVRRDHLRFLVLIEVIAFIHQRQRKSISINGDKSIHANLIDYAIARRLAGKILSQTIKAISPATEQLLNSASELQEKNGASGTITVAMLTDSLGWPKRKVQRCVKEACDIGYIELVEATKGKAFQYRFKSLPETDSNLLLSPEEIELRIEADRAR